MAEPMIVSLVARPTGGSEAPLLFHDRGEDTFGCCCMVNDVGGAPVSGDVGDIAS
jgi:hypothetical protein